MAKQKKKRKRHIAELADGDYESPIDVGNEMTEERIRTVMGEDGIEETHVTYERITKKPQALGFGKNYNKIDWTK